MTCDATAGETLNAYRNQSRLRVELAEVNSDVSKSNMYLVTHN